MKPDRIEHIVWDWNGTLLDDIAACTETINGLLQARRMPPLSFEEYREIFGFPVRDCYVKLGFDFSRENWDDVATEFHRLYDEHSIDAPLRERVPEILDRLRSLNVPMSVLSASEHGRLDRMIRVRGIHDFFKRVTGLTDLYAHSKLELGKSLLASIPTVPRNILIVGDTTHDFEVARDLDCRCVLLTGGHQSERRLRQCPCPVLSDPAEIVGLLAQFS